MKEIIPSSSQFPPVAFFFLPGLAKSQSKFTNDVSDGLEEAGRLRTGCVDHSYIRGGDVKGDPNKMKEIVIAGRAIIETRKKWEGKVQQEELPRKRKRRDESLLNRERRGSTLGSEA
uniref:Uncharacterized protein n=1 Tax=Ananas comosus var. bracteatus TaxID=296719 RepID=A0A6V7PZ53_ANACO|nr:unnamed protein product [Ananas comosus var. bracteatus]